MELLSVLENNALSIWLRESPSVLAYPTFIAFHTWGMALLVGTSVAICLRTVGIAPDMPLRALRGFLPVMWVGLGLSAFSGLFLLILDARTFLTMPTFWLKLAAIAVAMTLMRKLGARVFSGASAVNTGPAPSDARMMAGGVLLSWLVAVTAGRVTAYATFIGWQTAIAVVIVALVLFVGGRLIFGSNKTASSTR